MSEPPTGGPPPSYRSQGAGYSGGTIYMAERNFTRLPPDETCEVRRPDLRRICKDVRLLKTRRPHLTHLRTLAVACLSVIGFGASGLINYFATSKGNRPANWLETIDWIALAVGVLLALTLWLWHRDANTAFDREVDRIAADIESLDL